MTRAHTHISAAAWADLIARALIDSDKPSHSVRYQSLAEGQLDYTSAASAVVSKLLLSALGDAKLSISKALVAHAVKVIFRIYQCR